MSRDLPAALSSATSDPYVIPVMFVELLFDDGAVRLHTDLGDIVTTDTSPNLTWTGAAGLGSIDPIEESEEISPFAVKLRLSGIDSTILNEAVAENYYERPGRILIGMRDTVTGLLVSTIHEIFYGKMDSLRVMYSVEQSAIEVLLESEMADFDRASMKHYTDSQLQRDYSGDLGLQYLSQLVDAKVLWGLNNATLNYAKGGTVGRQTPFQNRKYPLTVVK